VIVEAEMRGFECAAGGARLLVPALTLLFLAWVPQVALAGPTDPIPDLQIDADQFDDTIAFTAADDADAAIPPLEVHEVDASKAEAAGAKKVVDGKAWLDADNYERNDILNLVEEDMPEGTELVIDVSTGDIWQVPLADGAPLPGGIRPWSDEEFYELDEYWEPKRIYISELTRKKFLSIAGVADSGDHPAQIIHIKPFGPIGYRDIQTREGFQVALAATWLRETPIQRYMRLVMLRNYFSRLPQFQGEGNQLVFGLMVPGGSLYAMPYLQYRNLLAQSGIRAWTLYDMAMLPVVLTVLDRQIRGDRVIDRVKIP
jgi:hypothetical protein